MIVGFCKRKKVLIRRSSARATILVEHLSGRGVAGFAIQCKTQVIGQVVVAGINQGLVVQAGELLRKRFVQRLRVAAVVTIPGAGVK